MLRSYARKTNKKRPRRGSRTSARLRKRALRAFRVAPFAIKLVAGVTGMVMIWFAANWTYQVMRKPTELFFAVSGVLLKTPSETWRKYEPIFRVHSTAVITPDLLAALAQVEGSGNPLALTYWRWY